MTDRELLVRIDERTQQIKKSVEDHDAETKRIANKVNWIERVLWTTGGFLVYGFGPRIIELFK